jgi:hypothetical protein
MTVNHDSRTVELKKPTQMIRRINEMITSDKHFATSSSFIDSFL